MGSMRGLLIMAGPGIHQGRTLSRTVWLTDIAPTICYLAEIPIPRQAEGGVIYQALEDPDIKLHQLERSRENYRRVMRAFSSDEAETHRRGV
jgi:arylsulfatase A-like enzyme